MKLLFSTSKRSVASFAVRYFTNSQYSHVEKVHEGGDLIGADGYNGVNIVKIEHRMEKGTGFLLCEQELTPGEELVFANFMQGKLGKKYDWGAIISFPFRGDWQSDNRWVCSEIIAAAGAKCKNPLLSFNHFNPSRITPRDLLLSPKLSVLSDDPQEILSILRR